MLPTGCDPSWHVRGEKTQNCDRFAKRKWCKPTGKHYGENWRSGWGKIEEYTDAKGRSALVCPQCGCGKLQ